MGVGIGGALVAGRLLAGFLFGIGGSDPLTFVGATLFLLVLGLLASYLPARRALQANLSSVLRAE